MSTENAALSLIISDADLQKAQELDNKISTLLKSGLQGLALTLARTKVITEISSYLNTEVMKPVLALENKKYGFLTDLKGDEKYKPETVKDCFIDALLNGVEPTGNQFNIISAKCYITKEGCKHKLRKAGVIYTVTFGNSYKQEGDRGQSYMPTTVEYKTPDNRTGKKTIDFPIRVFEKTTEAAMRGMAERDILAWLIEEFTGANIPVGSVEKDITVDAEAEEVKDDKVVLKIDAANSNLTEEQKKLQTDGDIYLNKAASKETINNLTELNKRRDYIVSKFPEYNLDVYNSLVEKLPK